MLRVRLPSKLAENQPPGRESVHHKVRGRRAEARSAAGGVASRRLAMEAAAGGNSAGSPCSAPPRGFAADKGTAAPLETNPTRKRGQTSSGQFSPPPPAKPRSSDTPRDFAVIERTSRLPTASFAQWLRSSHG